ncbi:MAG: porin [Thermodesulfobacteriota bacterium]
MKKVLGTMAALGLVAGVASTASAVEWKMTGKYLVEGYYMSDAGTTTLGVDLTETAAASNTSDAWYQHTFEVSPTMKVNDKISMMATIRLVDNTVWGAQTDGDTESADVMDTANDFYLHTMYMKYMSPIGEVRIGRHPAGGYGTTFADTDSRQDRIMWWPSFVPKPWSVLLFTGKNFDNDLQTGSDVGSDQNFDHYEARLNYKDDALDAGIRYSLSNDNRNTTGSEKELYAGYAKYKMNNYFANAEVAYFGGDSSTTVDWDALGYMLEVGGKFNNLTVSAMYFFAEGDDEGSANDNEGFFNATASGIAPVTATGTGHEFTPLYVLTGRTTGLLNPDQTGVLNGGIGQTDDGVKAFVLAADYKVSDRLGLHAAIGYAEADEETATYDDEYGWEYNIGAAYKLLDNLTYEAHFGYLDTGDYFKGAAGANQTENVYLLSHSLTMTF